LRVRYLLIVDLLGITLSIVAAFILRYEAPLDVGPYLTSNWYFFVLVPLVRLPVYFGFKLYYRLWRYASMRELQTILMAAALSTAIIYLLNFHLLPLLGLPYMRSRSVWLLEGVLSLALLAGSRLVLRLIQERYRPAELAKLQAFARNPARVLIVGAGDAGALIVREMLTSRHLGLHVVGFVDDDPQKQRLSIHNVPVLGKRTDVPALVKNHAIDQIVIAIPSAPGRDVREIVQICEGAGIMPRTVPGIYELIEGSVSLTHLRPIEIEDLLRRDPVQTDSAAVRELLHGKRVLVTGGGGSIGSELCRQILRARPARLILLGHGENSVFEIQNELLRECRKQQLPPETIHGIIADVRFGERILTIFRQLRPEIIFHAAAHKHVPLMEENPAEAITNNVLGTRNILAAARAVGVQRFVMISTDKAVNPTSIMGASKRTAELLVHEMALATGKPYMAVRFGNVLGSRGSVVLTFKQQIAAGGPVTVTDPEMKRFFMTIPEAVQLVLQAGVLGHGGEVFLLDMGEPVKIVDLARDLIELSGLEVGRDIDIVFSGLRPGEKLFEELFIPGEEYRRTEHQKIFIAANASSFVPADLEESIALLAHAADSNDRDLIVRGLQALIPEYDPPEPPAAPGEAKPSPRIQPELTPVASA
jgi:FlaA1/EpsC-like NDP-sugar epimerase